MDSLEKVTPDAALPAVTTSILRQFKQSTFVTKWPSQRQNQGVEAQTRMYDDVRLWQRNHFWPRQLREGFGVRMGGKRGPGGVIIGRISGVKK
jgi:hypothetical protein